MGSQLLYRQSLELTKKNVRLQLRNRAATCTQLFVGVFFIFLLLVMDSAVQKLNTKSEYMMRKESPFIEEVLWEPQRHCEKGSSNCFSFIYGPTSAIANRESIENVVSYVREVLNIDNNDTKYFPNKYMMEQFFRDNQNGAVAAVYFENSVSWDQNTSSRFQYVMQVNETKTCKALRIIDCDKPKKSITIPLQNAIDAAFVKVYGNSTGNGGAKQNEFNPDIQVQFSDFAHPDLPSNFDVVSSYGSTFLYIAVSFNYVIQFTLIVEEKELNLIQSMRQVGLITSAYWLSWFLVDTAVNTLMVLLIICAGYVFGLELFTETSFGLLTTFLWVSSMSFTAFAFFFSTFTKTASSARLIGIGMFIVTFIAVPLVVQLIILDGDEAYDAHRTYLSLLPPFPFYHVVNSFIASSSGQTVDGTQWKEIGVNELPSVPENINGDSYWSVKSSLTSTIKGFFIFSALAWYFDNVLPNNGKSLPPWFLFLPSYWLGHTPKKGASKNSPRVLPEFVSDPNVDEGVQAEMKAVMTKSYGNRDIAVEIEHLTKVFNPGGLLYPSSFNAVDGVNYAIEKNSIFVLLGHNGAGKTTTMNMLTGTLNITHGDAKIYGLSAKYEMNQIRKLMGVCPQHDVLWDQITGREHLEIYARIKGVREEDIESQVTKILKDMMLISSQHVRAGEYSGGMRRRLSVGIALVGDPKIVFLDEPTTGMDPVTRKAVWRMISKARTGRVIVLTTHSMEEADILGDRIAIMSKGKIQAIGTSLYLKQRYGAGYRITLSMSESSTRPNIINFFKENAPTGTSLLKDTDGVLQFQFPNAMANGELKAHEREVLPDFFKLFEQNLSPLGVSEYSLSMPTLDEVFLKLAEEENTTNFAGPAAATQHETTKDQDNAYGAGTRSKASMQLKALFMKSYSYQKSQKTSCCCIVLFPLLVMLMILAIDFALLQPIKLENLCGDFPREECVENGPNIECLLQLQSITTLSHLTPIVGEINVGGYRGGINPNCDEISCFYELEKPKFMDVPVYTSNPKTNGFGIIEFIVPDLVTIRNWYADLQLLLSDLSCEINLDNNFDAAIACENETSYVASQECQKQVKELVKARQYVETANVGGNLNNICGTGTNNEIALPKGSVIETVQRLQSRFTACKLSHSVKVWDHFESINLTAMLENTSMIGSGVLKDYTTAIVQDPFFEIFFEEYLVSILMKYYGNDNVPDVSLLDICSVPNILETITNVTGSMQVSKNVCAFIMNIDAIRGMSFKEYPSKTSVRVDGQLNNWFGEEIQTPFMKEYEKQMHEQQKYLSRHFYSHWQSYEFLSGNNNTGQYHYTAFYNNSGSGNTKDGNWQSLVWLMNNAIVNHHTGKGVEVKVQSFPKNLACNRDAWLSGSEDLKCDILPRLFQVSILDFLALTLFPYLLLIHMFVVVSLIVYEKENRLRIIMKTMGLSSHVYWVINFAFYYLQYCGMIGLMWFMGRIANLQLFSLHDNLVLFLFFSLWGGLLIVFSFLLTVLFKSSRTTTASIFLFLLIVNTTGSNLIETMINDSNTTEGTYAALMWLPPLVMVRGIMWLSLAAAFGEKVTLDTLSTYGGGSLRNCFIYMVVEIFLYGLLFWYLDKVYVADFGVRSHPLFFLQRDYWFPSRKDAKSHAELKNIPIEESVKKSVEYPIDIKAEYERAVVGGQNINAQIVHLHKRFRNGKVAVKSVSLSLRKNECLGLLGHNGAGKTTFINMISGLFEPTYGEAYFDGFSIRTHMDEIHRKTGVCPQHNVLWNSLNAYDHLRFYGRLKGLSGKALSNAIAAALESVNLTYAAKRQVKTYSGGMKRRLSVANALIGNPMFVFLDEPSTGLDPASKKQLWNVIKRAKGNKSIILTTHSMEEAEVLCDRIAVMAIGKLQCIDSTSALKLRYGKGYTLFLCVSNERNVKKEEVIMYVRTHLPSAVSLQEPVCGLYKFEVDRKDVVISEVFKAFENAKDVIGVSNWGLTETTLEEVFLKLANMHSGGEIKRASLAS